ncbi:MAG: GNAT family N-acetyltransferase [Phaeodactylibacter sp.]|nr:GNAT family N-acetyltransferase [Phaeodactylibacter sp.]
MEFKLRPWRMDDLPSLLQYADNANIARNLTDKFPHPYSEEAGKGFLERVIQGNPPSVLAIDVDGVAVGAIGVHPQEDIMCRNAEMGYWLAEPFWGNGILSSAIPQMVRYGFEHFDIDRIYARPFGSNRASQRVLEKAGFVLEGRFEKTIYKWGRYEDELFYAVRRER